VTEGIPDTSRISYELYLRLYPPARSWKVWQESPETIRLRALAEIEAQQLHGALPFLVPLSVHANERIRTAAGAATAHLLSNDFPNSLTDFSNGLQRTIEWSYTDALSALEQLSGETIRALRLEPDAAWAVFGLLSFHSNGWIREAAVDRLADVQDGREIPFLLYRANDWVGVVAGKAEALLAARIEQREVRQLSISLPTAFALQHRSRGPLRNLVASLASRISRDEDVEFLKALANKSANRGFRRWLYSLILASAKGQTEAAELAATLRKDLDPILRRAGWQWVWERQPTELELKKAASDPWPVIRCRSLEILFQHHHAACRDMLLEALFDSAASVRATSRYLLDKLGLSNVADLYRKRFESADAVISATEISGLGETGIKEDVNLLRPFLTSPRISLRRAAIIAVNRLDPAGFTKELKLALADTSKGISKTARQILAKRSGVLGIEFLMEMMRAEQPDHVKTNALLLTRALTKWERMVALLQAVKINPALQAGIREEIHRWLTTFNRSWYEPTNAQLTTLTQLVSAEKDYLGPQLAREFAQILSTRIPVNR
jgi:HEAT repeat protein